MEVIVLDDEQPDLRALERRPTGGERVGARRGYPQEGTGRPLGGGERRGALRRESFRRGPKGGARGGRLVRVRIGLRVRVRVGVGVEFRDWS